MFLMMTRSHIHIMAFCAQICCSCRAKSVLILTVDLQEGDMVSLMVLSYTLKVEVLVQRHTKSWTGGEEGGVNAFE